MKVAIVCPYAFDAPGGVQDQVARLVRWLDEAGHQAWAVAPGEGGPPGTRSVGSFRTLSVNRSRAAVSVDPRAIRRVGEAVADADVVHVHEPFVPMVSLGALIASTPPRVGTFHADPSGAVRTAYKAAAPLLDLAARRLDVVTAVSQVAASAVDRLPGIRVIPNGLDIEDYRSDPEPLRVMFLGRDDPRKGLDVLLQAWPLIRHRSPNAVLRVVGAERATGPEGVEFLGRLDDAAKRDELAAAAVLAAPNLGGESFGIVVAEGLASGCAVVASDIPAFRAVAGDAAVYVPPGDPVRLADEIGRLLGDEALLQRMGEQGSRRATLFGRDVVLPAYLATYRDALDA
ncbi:MAG TPA: glycosyltransferase family 4 protein [Acidimicrobiia bacterium]|nr:glycosyltransferase family 4 protein [Acidimicrobiia bacterium]